MKKLLTTSLICTLGALATYANANEEKQIEAAKFVDGIQQAEAQNKDELAQEFKSLKNQVMGRE